VRLKEQKLRRGGQPNIEGIFSGSVRTNQGSFKEWVQFAFYEPRDLWVIADKVLCHVQSLNRKIKIRSGCLTLEERPINRDKKPGVVDISLIVRMLRQRGEGFSVSRGIFFNVWVMGIRLPNDVRFFCFFFLYSRIYVVIDIFVLKSYQR